MKAKGIIAVEYGASIEVIFEQFSRSIRDDLTEREEYKGCMIDIFPYEAMGLNCYKINTTVIPPYGQSNTVVSYRVAISELG